jgi:hypothetical protein
VARTTITRITCDQCNTDIPANTGGVVRTNPNDKRKQPKQAELCDACLEKIPGTTVKRRGRPAKAAA